MYIVCVHGVHIHKQDRYSTCVLMYVYACTLDVLWLCSDQVKDLRWLTKQKRELEAEIKAVSATAHSRSVISVCIIILYSTTCVYLCPSMLAVCSACDIVCVDVIGRRRVLLQLLLQRGPEKAK